MKQWVQFSSPVFYQSWCHWLLVCLQNHSDLIRGNEYEECCLNSINKLFSNKKISSSVCKKLSCKLAVGLFFRNSQVNYIPRKPKAFITSKNQASHLCNEGEKLGESSPISTEKIQRFSTILTAKLILKGLDKHKIEFKFWIQSVLTLHLYSPCPTVWSSKQTQIAFPHIPSEFWIQKKCSVKGMLQCPS